MFQSFDTTADPSAAPPRVARLRELMARHGADAYLVPRADEHQGEYVAPSAERLRWLTGFSGSAGAAAVTAAHAALFVDGRYTIQAAGECDPSIFAFPGIAQAKLADWLGEHLKAGACVGFDPWLHTAAEIDRLGTLIGPKGLQLKPVSRNLVDIAWGKDRPPAPTGPLVVHPLKRAGRSAADKIGGIQRRLAEDHDDAVILTLPDSIAWLFNIRGSDVAHNPVALAFAIVPVKGQPELFIDPAKVGPDVRAHLETIVRLAPPNDLAKRIDTLKRQHKKVRLDTRTGAYALARKLGKQALSARPDPCLAAKAIKNTAEITGTRRAHVRDGAVLARFLFWLDDPTHAGRLDEIAAATRLETLRADTRKLRDISFDTISGSGPNGAIVHYRVTRASNRVLRRGELFLIDSGAQYDDGTTDVTRTIAIGPPSAEMRERFTLVLKGHIAIARARFPAGTRGQDLDPLARRALWEHGLDYDHGTGHGVGSFLSVHEGPQSISRTGQIALEPGMIVSNEPGYYKAGHYGIRIENLVLVTKPSVPEGGERAMLGFETLTLAPIDRRLIVRDMLTREERSWLDDYHARVGEEIGPHLDNPARTWLESATRPL